MTRFDTTFRDYVAPTGWTLSRALEVLDVSTEPFDYERNSGADGYSYSRVISIRPNPGLWSTPVIAAHELAHIVLQHTEFVHKVEQLGVSIMEIPFAQFELEAHMVARAVCFGLELPPEDFPLDMIQRYIDSIKKHAEPMTEDCAVRLAWATLEILDAGLVPALEVVR